MTNVIITGLPENALLKKVIFILRKKLKKEGVKNFWILNQWNGDNKQVIIKFDTGYDAHRSLRVLDNFIYISNFGEYPLRARIESNRSHKSPSPYDLELDPLYDGYDRHYRERSRSPLHSREVSKLDLEIELLRKQRQVMEEERRLLLERKKLDLIREFGPNAINDFDYIEEPYERRRPEREQSKRFKRRQSPPPKSFQTNFTPKGDVIPKFFLPCKKLMDKMKNMTKDCANKQEAELLAKLVRTTIRKRIAVALEGKNYMSTPNILTMYRERYPVATDHILVTKLLKGIRDSMLSFEDKSGEERRKNKRQETTNELNKAGPSSVGGLKNDSANVEIKKNETKVNDNHLKSEEVKENEKEAKTNEKQVKIKENQSKINVNQANTSKIQVQKHQNQDKTDENQDKTDENLDKTDENQGETDENQAKTNKNQGEINENQKKTDLNQGKTDGNEAETNEKEIKIDLNQAEVHDDQGKIDEKQAKTNEDESKADDNQANTNEDEGNTNENQANTNENGDKTNENQVESIGNQSKDKEINNGGSLTLEDPEHDAEANKGLFEDGTDWNDDGTDWNDDEQLGVSAT